MPEITGHVKPVDRFVPSEISPNPNGLSALLPTIDIVLTTAQRIDDHQRSHKLELPTTFDISGFNTILPLLRDRIQAEVRVGTDDLASLDPKERHAVIKRVLDRPNYYSGGMNYPFTVDASGNRISGGYFVDINDNERELAVVIGAGFYAGDLQLPRPAAAKKGRDLTRTLGAVGALDPEHRITPEQAVAIGLLEDLIPEKLSSYGMRVKSLPRPDIIVCHTNIPSVDLEIILLAGQCHQYRLIQHIRYSDIQK